MVFRAIFDKIKAGLTKTRDVFSGIASSADHQRHSTRKCPAIGRVSAQATTRSRSETALSALVDAPRTISKEAVTP